MVDLSNNSDNNIIGTTSIKTRKRDSKKSSSNDSCHELKSIAYKTMLLNGVNILDDKIDMSKNVITDYLKKEIQANKDENWPKLDKTQKIKKMVVYIETLLKSENNLSEKEITGIIQYLTNCLDKKFLCKAKDVVYNKETKLITNIPNLLFNKDTRELLLTRNDKHVSTVKSLAPKKNKTIKS
jgi:hypothetical protein|tara:strand:- start:13333 stop:13881 length:549 start_codon:yes stop_codon:yes gene_type:complete